MKAFIDTKVEDSTIYECEEESEINPYNES